ncbi:ATP-binding cassette domain-containing protein [Actinophytocola sp.]|uniref:ATP-binding cassette domain-containing protein n=1 Tax=Actinophytocola sp. TaxID=1872138 RepID=UPI0038999999
MIRLVGVAKRYGRGPFVVAGVDAEVRGGEVLVVHGPNGAGKSTLLRLVVGSLAPTHGRVLGRPATVGYVPDRFPARLRMPAGAYLRHMQRIRPTTTGNPAALLERLAFRGGLRTPMSRLSKGNAQKVGLAQALCSGAPLLVLDEPWSGLDAEARPVLTTALQQLVAGGVAVVVSDHTRTAETLVGHRSVLLHSGGLTDANAGPRTVAVTVRCARPDQAAERLSGFGAVERHAGELSLRVPPGDVDALLIAALRLGCSVREVRECVD